MSDKVLPATQTAPRMGQPEPAHLVRMLPQLGVQASVEWLNDNAPRLGASVAFYALLSLAPVIVVAVAVAAVVYGHDAALGRLAIEIESLGGPELARSIQEVIKNAYQPGTGVIATFFGVLTLIYGATSMFVELRDAINTIWGVPLPSDKTNAARIIRLLRERFYSFATVTGIGFLLLIALLVNALISTMNIAVPPVATFVFLYLLVASVFATFYKILPDVNVTWYDVALGALLAAALFMLGKHLMGMYFANKSFRSSYGAAGSPIVILLWVYYSAQLFFWGAEFSKVFTRTLGSHRVQPH